MNANATYHEFEHPAKEISRYIEAAGLFSVLLKNGDIVHFTPSDKKGFKAWLVAHQIKNARN